MKKLYYVVRPQLVGYNCEIPEHTGWKYITVFNITDNIPTEIVNLDVFHDEDSIHQIEQYFSEYLPEYSDCELIQL